MDALQGEMAIISEDVEVVKKQLDEGILLGDNSFLQMLGSRSLSNSVASGRDGSVAKLDDAGNSQHAALSQSGSSYQSATRVVGEGGVAQTEDLSNSELVEAVSRISLTNNSVGDPEESFAPTTDFAADEGWHFLETSSARSNNSPIESPNSGKRIRSF